MFEILLRHASLEKDIFIVDTLTILKKFKQHSRWMMRTYSNIDISERKTIQQPHNRAYEEENWKWKRKELYTFGANNNSLQDD